MKIKIFHIMIIIIFAALLMTAVNIRQRWQSFKIRAVDHLRQENSAKSLINEFNDIINTNNRLRDSELKTSALLREAARLSDSLAEFSNISNEDSNDLGRIAKQEALCRNKIKELVEQEKYHHKMRTIYLYKW